MAELPADLVAAIHEAAADPELQARVRDDVAAVTAELLAGAPVVIGPFLLELGPAGLEITSG